METSEIYSLAAVVGIDEEKCVNCHACIAVCPVKYCNDGSGNKVNLNANMCIACGSCISACTHKARFYIDDFQHMLHDLAEKDDLIAVVAPSVAASFPNLYLNLNGRLKSIGIKAVFDVSFGAELTVKSYLEHIVKNNPKLIIAQPCPSLVTYIQLYQPELIKYLAPADSPILHTIKMVKEFYKPYQNSKVVVISPCNAKKREFQQTGLGDYNVAYQSIDKYLKENHIDLSEIEKSDFDNPPAERAVLFSAPGGLIQTVERTHPEIKRNTRIIEGVPKVYEYLKHLPEMLEKQMSPLLIDCLSCEYGCNAGPLTLVKEKSVEEIEFWVHKRRDELIDMYRKENEENEILTNEQIDETIKNYWKQDLYNRTYLNLWRNIELKYPTKDEIDTIFHSMHKYKKEDQYNCTSCGYGKCEQMAIAIFNNLNRPENCHFYLAKETEISHKEVIKSKQRFSTIIETSLEGFLQIDVDNIMIDANPALKSIVKKNDLIGRNIFEFVNSENAIILNEQLELRKKNIKSSYEINLSQSDENLIPCLISAAPIFDENGNFQGSFAMVTDISKIKAAEEELKKANDFLEQRVIERTAELQETIEELNTVTDCLKYANIELEKLSIVASKTDNAILIMDSFGNVEWINDAFTRLHEVTLDELLSKFGKNLKEFSANVEIEKIIKECVENKISINYESTNLNPEHHKVWIQTTLSPVVDENDEVIKLIAIDIDISSLKNAQEEIVQQNEELKQQSEEILAQTEQLSISNELLEASQKKLQHIIEFLPDATIVVNKEKQVIAWNKACEQITGIKAAEILGKGDYEYAVPFYGKKQQILIDYVFLPVDEIKTKYSNIKIEGNTLFAESFVPNLNGTGAFLMGAASILYDGNGEVTGAIEVLRDITDRKKAEEALKDSEKRMANIIECLPDAAFVIDKEKKVIAWNKAIYELTGVNAEQMIGKGDYEYAIPFYQERRPVLIDLVFLPYDEFDKKYENVTRKGNTLVAEGFIPNLKGEGVYILGTASILYNSHGEITGAIEIVRDITEKKKAEIALKEAFDKLNVQNQEIEKQKDQIVQKTIELTLLVEQLQTTNQIVQANNDELSKKNTEIENQQNEIIKQNKLLKLQQREIVAQSKILRDTNKELERLSLVASKTSNAVIITDGTGKFEWINEGFTRLFDFNLEQLVENKGNNIIGPNTEPAIKDLIATCFTTKQPINYEYFAPVRTGGGKWVQTSLAPILNEFGNISRMVSIVTDITSLKEAEEKIRIQKEEILAKSMEMAELIEEIQATNEIVQSINSELNTTNTEIQRQKEELQNQNELLLQQKEEITKQRDEIAIQKKNITDSILYAKRIQSAILPSETQFNRLLPHNFILYKPKDIVSGDFYWIRQKNTKIYLAVADCTGHGVPGAFMSMLGYAFLNEILNSVEKNTNADEILNLLRSQIIKALRQKGKIGEAHDGMDITFLIIDYDLKTFQYAGANNQIYLIRSNSEITHENELIVSELKKPLEKVIKKEVTDDCTLIEIKPDDMPIGMYIYENISFTFVEVSFKKGDLIYLFTDGYVSQFGGPKGRKFLSHNFKKLLFEIHEKSLDEQKLILNEKFEEWKGVQNDQIDDVLVVGIRF